jgi:hypothetical protein
MITRRPDHSLLVRRDPSNGQVALVISLQTSHPATRVEIDGKPVHALATSGSRLRIAWQAEHRPETVLIQAPAGDRLDLRYSVWTAAWPAAIAAPPPITPRAMAWDRAGSSVFTGQQRIGF